MAPGRISPSVGCSDTDGPAPAVQAPQAVYHGYHHITWWVGNAKQAASYYITRFGFREIAYSGLETGSRSVASRVIENGGVRFVLSSPIRAATVDDASADAELLEEMHRHLERHGDAVKDVAFEVDDVEAIYDSAVKQGAVGVQVPTRVEDEHGAVKLAVIQTYGQTTHTLLQKDGYDGVFLPGYRAEMRRDPMTDLLPQCALQVIDHCVGNQDWDEMEDACDL